MAEMHYHHHHYYYCQAPQPQEEGTPEALLDILDGITQRKRVPPYERWYTVPLTSPLRRLKRRAFCKTSASCEIRVKC